MRELTPSLNLLKGKKDLVGIELGVGHGKHTLVIFRELNIKKLYLIDCYHQVEYRPDKELAEMKEGALKIIEPFKDSVEWIFKFTADAVAEIPDESCDFIFIDAGHYPEDFYLDVNLYTAKIKPGGLVAGHNYDRFPVRKVIDKYAKRYGYRVRESFRSDKKQPPSDWWFIKKEEIRKDINPFL